MWQVREAVLHGAKAVILYNDPADVNVNLTYNVFPASWWLPGNDVEHGSVRIGRGDPSTPGYPATGEDLKFTIFLTHDLLLSFNKCSAETSVTKRICFYSFYSFLLDLSPPSPFFHSKLRQICIYFNPSYLLSKQFCFNDVTLLPLIETFCNYRNGSNLTWNFEHCRSLFQLHTYILLLN